MLKEIGTANRHDAYRLLQCLTVAIRPLRLEELAEILALDFDGAKEGIPVLKEDWRWKDQQQAVLSTCSSLVAVVHDGFHRVVQFSHFSVKEFLTSDRLAASSMDISRFHILPKPAHTVIAKACFGILLRSDIGVVNAGAQNNSPLAKYAAMHWVEHSQFEVLTHLQVGMRPLFDPAKPYFEAWLELYENEPGWHSFISGTNRGPPLYYASLYGFHDLAVHLISKHPQDVNTLGGRCLSPLVAALYNRHFDIAELLYQHGADIHIRGHEKRTLLHAASKGGFIDIAQWLFDHCVGTSPQQDDDKTLETPLHLAEANGRPGHCKHVDDADDINHTPLHLASLYDRFEMVRLLIEHGANVNARGKYYDTPLHIASYSGDADTVRLLIKHGAEVNSEDRWHCTPLHLALLSGRAEIVQLLVEHGARVNERDECKDYEYLTYTRNRRQMSHTPSLDADKNSGHDPVRDLNNYLQEVQRPTNLTQFLHWRIEHIGPNNQAIHRVTYICRYSAQYDRPKSLTRLLQFTISSLGGVKAPPLVWPRVPPLLRPCNTSALTESPE